MQETLNFMDGDLVAFEAKVCRYSSMVEEMKSAEPILCTRAWMTYLGFKECERIKFVKGYQGFWTDDSCSVIAVVPYVALADEAMKPFYLIPFSEDSKLWSEVERMIHFKTLQPSGYFLHELQRGGVVITLP